MAITTTNIEQLIRDEIWSQRVQDELQEELFGQDLVEFITDFPDGDLLTIPTLASLSARAYTENDDITVDDPTVGEFQLAITEYNQAGIVITDKMKQDTFYMSVLIQKFPEQATRAILERLESDIMLLHKKQTSNDANVINGRDHRFLATGTSNAMTLADVRKAKLSLDKGLVSKVGRKAIVDPSVSSELLGIDNIIRQDVYGQNSNLKDGFGSTRSIGTYLGVDWSESNMLDEATALNHVAGGSLIANMFIGDEAFLGAMRLLPTIEKFRQATRKRDVFHVTTRYGLGLFRAVALIVVLTGAG